MTLERWLAVVQMAVLGVLIISLLVLRHQVLRKARSGATPADKEQAE